MCLLNIAQIESICQDKTDIQTDVVMFCCKTGDEKLKCIDTTYNKHNDAEQKALEEGGTLFHNGTTHEGRMIPKAVLAKQTMAEFVYYYIVDNNKDGTVSPEEMSRILTEHYSASELAEKFELADTNDDGKLSMEEYLKAV